MCAMSSGPAPEDQRPGEVPLKTYVGALAAFAAALAVSWAYWYGVELDARILAGTAVFAGLVLASFALSLRIGDHTVMGTWDVWLVLAVVALGPTWAALAAVPTALFVGRRDWLRAVYDIGQNVITVHLAGAVFSLASGPLLLVESADAAVCYGALAAGATLVVANEVIDGGLLRVKYGQPFRETWEENWRPYLPSDAVNVLTVGLGVLAFVVYGPLAAAVAVVGSMVSRALVHRSRDKVREIGELRARVSSLEEALNTSNTTFGAMIVRDLGRKDGFTDRHAAATAVYAADLARELGMDEARVGRLRLAGLLHNVGLLGLPEELLLATGKPNSIAQSRLAEHPARGEEALAAVPEFGEMASWVRWHHERPDGRGYPDKLRGPWIPAEAKVLAVAQAYAALVLDGPSRPGVSPAQAREKLGAGADTEFDGVVVRALLRILDTESEGYRMADDHRFVFPAAGGGRSVISGTTIPGREGHGARSLGEERSQG
jgi:hypothetical protein